MNILHIDASARHQGSVSRALTGRIAARLGGEVVRRDLADAPPPLVTEAMIGAYFTPPEARTEAQRAVLEPSDALVGEVQAADVLVIGLPVYNFGPPAALKAWADLVARVGVTFRYTESGPEGLLTGKRAIVALASGGTAAWSDIDFATPWLRQFLGFIGITEVEVIAADALGQGDAEKVAAAEAAIDVLAA